MCMSVHMLVSVCLAELTAGVFNPTIKSVKKLLNQILSNVGGAQCEFEHR